MIIIWMHLKLMIWYRIEADREIGIAEDITTSYLERQRIEHERDYDVLTGLYNRFSFQDTWIIYLNTLNN